MRRQAEKRRVKKPSVISRGSLCWGLIHSPKATRAPGDSGRTRWVLMRMIRRAMHKIGAGALRELRRKFPANREKYRENCPPATPPTCGFSKISSIYLKLG